MRMSPINRTLVASVGSCYFLSIQFGRTTHGGKRSQQALELANDNLGVWDASMRFRGEAPPDHDSMGRNRRAGRMGGGRWEVRRTTCMTCGQIGMRETPGLTISLPHPTPSGIAAAGTHLQVELATGHGRLDGDVRLMAQAALGSCG
jgi:hypothetical protein